MVFYSNPKNKGRLWATSPTTPIDSLPLLPSRTWRGSGLFAVGGDLDQHLPWPILTKIWTNARLVYWTLNTASAITPQPRLNISGDMHMKVVCDKNELQHALQITTRALPTTTAIPELTHIWLETVDNSIRLSATNIKTFISTKIQAEIERPGEILVQGQFF